MSYRLSRWRVRRRARRFARMLAALPPDVRVFVIAVLRAAR
jgi:hypothetical protein